MHTQNKSYFIVKYKLQTENSNNITLELTNNSGKIVLSEKLNKKTGEKTIITSNFASGVYTLYLKSDVRVLQSVKVVIE